MGTPSQVYVDDLSSNTGTGTLGDPYASLEYALTQYTHDATNGTQINIASNGLSVLTAALAPTGSPTITAPIIFRGYTTTANDGGVGRINCNGNRQAYNAAKAHTHFIDLEIYGSSHATSMVSFTSNSFIRRCYLRDYTGAGSCCVISAYCEAADNRIEYAGTAGTTGLSVTSFESHARRNFLWNTAGTLSDGIRASSEGIVVEGNIVTGFNTRGIYGSAPASILHNSILCTGAAAIGIRVDNVGVWQNIVDGNLIEAGLQIFLIAADLQSYANNSSFGASSASSLADIFYQSGNETLLVTPYTKSGALSYANRLEYFAPADVGDVWYGTPNQRDRGAVQHLGRGGATLMNLGMGVSV